MRLIISTVVLAAIVWLSWNPLRTLLLGGHTTTRNSPEGEWVGSLDITGGYDSKTMGNTPGLHQHAAIKFTLAPTDRFESKFAGPGELFIQGEQAPRPIQITRLWLSDDGHASVLLHSPSHIVSQSKAQYSAGTLDLHQDDPWDLQFHGTLHHGTDQDYNRLRNLQAPTASHALTGRVFAFAG